MAEVWEVSGSHNANEVHRDTDVDMELICPARSAVGGRNALDPEFNTFNI